MKQKKYLFTLAASMMLAVTGFTSCTIEDNAVTPDQGGDEPEIIEPEDDPFDEGNLVKNGTANGTDVANFFANDFLTPDGEQQAMVPVRIVKDPADAGNRVFIVGTNNNAAQPWDAQFFITVGEDQAFNPGDKVTLKFKYKADKEQNNVGIQTHKAPGAYDGNLPGEFNINLTTEWQEFSAQVPVVESPAGWPPTQAKAGFYTFAFNLAVQGAADGGNNIYFDDVRVEAERYDPFEDGNLVKNGKANNDNVGNYLANDFLSPDGEQQNLVPARVIVDPTNETNRCFIVGTNNNAAQAWDAQFFITVGEDQAFQEGDKFHITFKYRADKEQSGVSIQSHKAPGAYDGNLPSQFNLTFTTEWQEFDSGDVECIASPGWGAPQAKAGFYTFAFNLSVQGAADGGNNMYFDDIRITVEKAPEVEYEWEEIQINGDLEGEDVSGIACREKGMADQYVIKAGVGKNGSRGTYVRSAADAGQAWDSQFFVVLPEGIPAGTKYKFQMDVRADDEVAKVSAQTHGLPGDYIGGAGIDDFKVTTEWSTITGEGTFASKTNEGVETLPQSFAFNLNEDLTLATTFYFDNIKVWIGKEKKK